MKEKKSKWPLVFIALASVIATSVYSGYTLLKFKQGIPEEKPAPALAGGTGPGRWQRDSPPTPEERQRRFKEIAATLELTPEQKNQIQEILSQSGKGGRQGGRERFRKVREILTPDQQEKAFGMFRSRIEQRMKRRLEEAKKSLPEKEVKVLEEQMNERLKQMETRMRERRNSSAKTSSTPVGEPAK